MKKLLLLVMCLCSAWTLAQNEQIPEYFPQGTVWTTFSRNANTLAPGKSLFKIDGIKTIGANEYKVIRKFEGVVYDRYKAEVVGHIRQEGRKIYRHASDEFMMDDLVYLDKVGDDLLLYDFDLLKGAPCGSYGATVDSVWTVTTNDGVERRAMEVGWVTLIEGIGAVNVPFFTPYGPFAISYNAGILGVFNEPGGKTINQVDEQYASDLMYHSGFSFVKEGVRWVERVAKNQFENDEAGVPSDDYSLVTYVIEGEESRNGKIYQKVMCNGKHVASLRQDADKTVYYLSNGQEKVLYHFNWEQNNRLQYEGENGVRQLKMLSESAMFLPDGYGYPYLRVENPSAFKTYVCDDVRLIQGIGLTTGLLSHIGIGGAPGDCIDLLAVYEGEKHVYRNPQFTEDGSYSGFKAGVVVEEGRSWNVLIDWQGGLERTLTTVLRGDTVLNGKVYKKIYETYSPQLVNLALKGCVRQEGAMVYYVPCEETQERLLFNFDGEYGTNLDKPYMGPFVADVDWMDVNGVCLPAQCIWVSSDERENDVHVAGIGSLQGGLFSLCNKRDGYTYRLLCSHQDDRLIYQDKDFSECYYGDVSADAGQEIRKPYRYADNCFLFDAAVGKIDFAVYDAKGNKLYAASPAQPVVSVGFLPAGIYFCRIETDGYAHWDRFVVTR